MTLVDLTHLKPYEGQWVALSPDDQRVVGHGATLAEAAKQAVDQGCPQPIFEKVPPSSRGLAMRLIA